MMATNVEEASQLAIVAAHEDDGLVSDFTRYVLTWFAQLIHARAQVP
jgi:hypothetical protein